MGASFTNVHVRLAAGENPARAVEAVAAEIRRALGTEFVEADGAAADRSVALCARDGWISVFDDALDSQAEAPLVALASALSATRPVITLLVHDSDVVDARLFAGGRSVDHYVSNPDFLEVPKKLRASMKGRPETWCELLGGDPERLRAVWDSKPLFAEAIVADMAAALGIDGDHAQGSYRHLGEMPDAAEFTRLLFRVRRRPAAVTSPPALRLMGWSPSCELSVGERADRLTFSLANGGRGSRGVVVVAGGDALEQGLLRLETVTLGLGSTRATAPLVPEAGTRGVARFPDFELPETAPHLPSAPQKSLEAALANQVFVAVAGEAIAAGTGTVQIAVYPTENAAGAAGQQTALTVRAPGRRPLRTRPEMAAQLRALDDPAVMSLLVVLADAGEKSRAAAVDAAATWCARVAAPGWNVTITKGLGQRPGTSRFAPKDVGGKRWAKLGAGLADGRVVTGQADVPAGLLDRVAFRHPFLRQAGFTLAHGSVMYEDAEAPLALALWRPGGTEEDAAQLAEVADAFVAGGALQAFVARWAWAPFATLDSTPYELAAAVHGQVTNTRRWCVRWLRAVTPTVWLGSELAARIDISALSALAAVTRQGPGFRVQSDARVLDAVEGVLEPVLPSHEDWISAREVMRPSMRRLA